jgi:pheromone shutdown protein TraB
METFKYQIVGTSHVAKESKIKIEKAYEEFKPTIICIELDEGRLRGLLSKEKSKMPPSLIFKIGLWGYLFSLVARAVQEGVGKKMNILPGDDMLAGVAIAQKHKLPVALIDQNIQITLQRLSKNFKARDKWNLFKDFFRGIFTPKKVMAEMGIKNMDLSKIPSDVIIDKAIGLMEKRYPGLYKTLVEERNHYMVNQIYEIFRKNPESRVLAVVGAGHSKGMTKLLNQKLLKPQYSIDLHN